MGIILETMSVEETLAELVGIESVSAGTNAAIISWLDERATAAGFFVKKFPYTDENGIEKINMIALAGVDFSNRAHAELALVGHTDTVPFADSWTDALQLTERDGRLYGRGSCDTKGFIAASLTAVGMIDLNFLKSPLALIFTADEEVGCRGARHLAEQRPLTVTHAIVGEPTSLRPMRAGKGYCLAEIIVRGQEGHSAYPSVGASAIFRAARIVIDIENIAEQLKAEGHVDFDPPFTTLNVGLIKGGTAKNIIAGECRITLEWRPIPGQNARYVLDLVSKAAEKQRTKDAGFECEIKASRLDEATETPADASIVSMLEHATGQRAGTVAFGTEAPQMSALGANSVVLGPGDIRVAHRKDEFVPIEELRGCVQIIKQAIEHFCM